MKMSHKAIVFVVTCVVVGFLLGLFSAFLVAHGEHAISLGQRAVISLGAAGFLTGISGFLSGNRAQLRASPDDDRLAKQFMPAVEHAVVYVFRDAFAGKLLGIDLVLDGHPLGQTRGKTYFRLELKPGEHVLSSRNPQDGSLTVHRFSVAARSVDFLEQRVGLGLRALKHEFVEIEAASAQMRVKHCRLLATPAIELAKQA